MSFFPPDSAINRKLIGPFCCNLPREREQNVTGRSKRRKDLLLAGWPLIAANVATVGLQLGDAWITSRLGTVALASLAVPGLFLFTMMSFGQGYSLPLISRFATQSQRPPVRHAAAQAGILAALGIVIALLGTFMANPALGAFQHPIQLLEMEVVYLKLGLFATAMKFGSFVIAAFFIAIQRTTLVLAVGLSTVTLNLGLSFGLTTDAFGLPNVGFVGVAIGTLVACFSELLIFSLCLWNLSRNGSCLVCLSIPIDRRGKRIAVFDQLRVGFPAGLHGAVDVIAWGAILLWFVGQFGSDHLAAATVLIRLMQVSFLPAEGIAIALVGFLGKSNRSSNARRYTNSAFNLIGSYMALCACAFLAFRTPLSSYLTESASVARIVADCILFVCVFQIFDAMNITFSSALLGTGDTAWPAAINFLLLVTILLGGGYTVIRFFPQLKSTGIWIVVMIYVASQGLLFYYRWNRNITTQNKIAS
ncbi:MAG: hypothetical protein KDN22_19890 [Verrucomicrobiae bacterium]|nr:hypothetical protein [Verrucomicrobiae bacterium]